MTCLTVAMGAQTAADHWQPFQFFAGEWRGEESASFGDGRGERTYEFIVQGRFLLGQNHSVFPPQDGLPDGDIHDDWTVFSYDSARETFVLRQFNSEGFVNTFVLQDPSTLPDRMVFVLVASENASGARGSLTYARQRDDTFEEVFELTMPGVDSPITIRNRWRRATP